MIEFFDFVWDSTRLILNGFPIVIVMTVASFFPALILGIVGGLMASSPFRLVRLVASTYVYIFRSIPFLMLIFVVYYGLPYYGLRINSLTTVIVALSLCHGAYMTEIIRGGLLGFDKGQKEAAVALGLNWWQRQRDIVLPQTLMAIIPSLLGQMILMIKDTSLVSVVGISELTRLAREIVIRTNEPFIIFTIVALIYFALCFGLEILARRLENKVRLIMAGN